MDDLRVQIVNYKTKRYLLECLSSVVEDLKKTTLNYTIGILENNSGEDLSGVPHLFPDVDIDVVVRRKNIGFGAGHNLLAKNKDAHYLLLLNPDIKFIETRTIDRMMKRAQDFPAQIIGPRLVTVDGNTQYWDHGELTGLLARIASWRGRSHWKRRKNPLAVAWVSGAVFLIEKNWFDHLGGFDENFFLYKEEEDLCLRLRQEDGAVIYDPTISVLHYGSVVAHKSQYMAKSLAYFREKHLRRKNT